MDRTGIRAAKVDEILSLVSAIEKERLQFRGLHYYDGHLSRGSLQERSTEACRGYSELVHTIQQLQQKGVVVEEVITSGTPTFPAALVFEDLQRMVPLHRVSPGTVVYCDVTSLEQLPSGVEYRPAAIVMSRVISHPREGIITCDAGHKTLSVDAGVPNCAILGRGKLRPLQPTEEHLPIEVPVGVAAPSIGEFLYLVPRHVCPTVNNFEHALVVRNGLIEGIESVSARGRERPLLPTMARRDLVTAGTHI
jgi:D-serine deaminase-like pyridoxal phosphate-dependent protein